MAINKITKKPALTGKTVGITAVASVAVITAGVLGYNVISNRKAATKTKPTTTTTQQQIQAPPAPQPIVANYSGTYTGTTSVSQGIANATAVVSASNTISGSATYVGPQNANIPLTITGNVSSNGAVSGTFSGSSKVQGFTVNVNGTYSGTITNNTMKVTYIASAFGTSTTSSITLTKK